LVGPKGGGDLVRQLDALRSIANHISISISEAQLHYVGDQCYSSKAATFRKGQIGDWINYFEPEHKDVFKALAGELLIELGYEETFDW